MTLSKIGRTVAAVVAAAALGLGLTSCSGGTIGYMWVLGTFYNQISGFKIDDFTGNLTVINHSPFSSGGSNPQSIVVKPGGRYLYVVNSGAGGTGAPGTPGYVAPTGSSIAEFAVGGDGVLTFQQNYFSQGSSPVWATMDTSGNFLYVLDKYSPFYNPAKGDFNGSITVFSIAGDTGRLTLVPNTQILNNNLPTTVFEVGPNPIMTKTGLGGCLFTLSPNSVYPYAISSSTGQLTVTSTGPFAVSGSSRLTSINTGLNSSASNFIYLTDAGANQIFSLQAGGTPCSLAPISGSQQSNLSGTANPVNSLTSTSGKFLYVLNQSSTASNQTNANSTISAFTINSLGQLQTLPDSTNNPYAVGSGPVCIVQDPTNQYLYITNNTDSTITGKLLDQNRGYLSNLSRGSVFPTSMKPTCLATSGNL